MAVILTEAAAKKATELTKEFGYLGLRLGIKGGGCAGFEYNLSLADAEHKEDIVSESYGVKVFCDKKSSLFVNGTEIDYKSDLMSSGFVFRNPNSKSECGCHKSFGV